MKLFKPALTILTLVPLVSAQQAPQPDPPPAQDFSGKWIMTKESTNRAGEKQIATFTLLLKQSGNKLTGEVSNNTIRMPGAAGFAVTGWVEANQMALTGYVDYQGGETTHLTLTFQDGHLVGNKKSWHDAPHKWHFDDTQDLDYTKSTQ